MRVISIDPGYERLGIAILEKKDSQKEILLFSECFKTSKDLSHEKRLFLIGKRIREVIEEYSPSALSIESLFLNTNQKTVMFVAEAKGVVLYEAAVHQLECFEFSPPQIKSSVCGNGRADKEAIKKMLPMLIQIKKEIKHDDEYDAIAVGITFFANKRYPQLNLVA